MLSEENINKLVLSGLYRAKPNQKIHDWYSEPYRCFNWTFKVKYIERDDSYYMIDTYFNDKYFKLSDSNIDLFEFIFDFNEVEKHNGRHIYDYDKDDIFHVAIDSGGMYCGGKYFIKKSATKNKDKVIERLNSEIRSHESSIEWLRRDIEKVENGEDLKYI